MNRLRQPTLNRAAVLVVCSLGLFPSARAEETASASITSSPPLTLRDCYRLALKRSEDIAIRQEVLNEAQGRFLQALSGVLPQVSFASSDKRQDGSGSSAFTLRYIPERKLVFSQPLFSGFKEFAAIAGSRAEHRQRMAEKARAEQLLLVDVADAFYLLIEQREDLSVLEAIRTALTQRIDELKERERLGRSRPSEVASAQAQLQRVEAQVEQARGQETTARQLLEFLIGADHLEAIADDAPLPPLEFEAAYVAKVDARSDVRTAEEAWRVARQGVAVAQSKLWPTVSVDGDYFIDRVGVSKDVNWDVALMIDVPLFQGGHTVGAIKEAAAHSREAQLQFAKVRRAAMLDIRNTYAKLRTAIGRTTALEQALAAAEENYRLQVQDYRLNLVNNLDALQALQALEDARRDVIQARYDAKRLYWQLSVAIGETL